jgi:hypothetical protein
MSPICRLVKGWETRPTILRPYHRRRESLTICRFYHKGSTFYSAFLRPWVLVRPGTRTTTSRTTDRCSTNWAKIHGFIAINVLSYEIIQCVQPTHKKFKDSSPWRDFLVNVVILLLPRLLWEITYFMKNKLTGMIYKPLLFFSNIFYNVAWLS